MGAPSLCRTRNNPAFDKPPPMSIFGTPRHRSVFGFSRVARALSMPRGESSVKHPPLSMCIRHVLHPVIDVKTTPQDTPRNRSVFPSHSGLSVPVKATNSCMIPLADRLSRVYPTAAYPDRTCTPTPVSSVLTERVRNGRGHTHPLFRVFSPSQG